MSFSIPPFVGGSQTNFVPTTNATPTTNSTPQYSQILSHPITQDAPSLA